MIPATTVEKPRVPCPPVRVSRPSTKKGADEVSAGKVKMLLLYMQLVIIAHNIKQVRMTNASGSYILMHRRPRSPDIHDFMDPELLPDILECTTKTVSIG